MFIPAIREVRTEDPNGFVRGVITMFEIVDTFDAYAIEPVSAHYTYEEAKREAWELI